jgi:hypothetical protein
MWTTITTSSRISHLRNLTAVPFLLHEADQAFGFVGQRGAIPGGGAAGGSPPLAGRANA